MGAGVSALTRLALLAVLCACAGSSSATPASAPCHAGAPEAGVYQPDRLKVLAPCAHAEGKVVAVVPELDGDHHIWIDVDAKYQRLQNAEDHFQGRPALLAEITPDCPLATNPANAGAAARCPKSEIPLPGLGDRVGIDGPWVFDTNHGWNEIHPVDTLKIIARA